MYIVLSARVLNPKLRIVSRAVDDERAQAHPGGRRSRHQPLRHGGHRLAHLILSPTVVDFFETALRRGNEALNIEAIAVSGESPAVGRTLEALALRQATGATVLAIMRDGNPVVNPPGDMALAAGDRLLAMGTRDDSSAWSACWPPALTGRDLLDMREGGARTPALFAEKRPTWPIDEAAGGRMEPAPEGASPWQGTREEARPEDVEEPARQEDRAAGGNGRRGHPQTRCGVHAGGGCPRRRGAGGGLLRQGRRAPAAQQPGPGRTREHPADASGPDRFGLHQHQAQDHGHRQLRRPRLRPRASTS